MTVWDEQLAAAKDLQVILATANGTVAGKLVKYDATAILMEVDGKAMENGKEKPARAYQTIKQEVVLGITRWVPKLHSVSSCEGIGSQYE